MASPPMPWRVPVNHGGHGDREDAEAVCFAHGGANADAFATSAIKRCSARRGGWPSSRDGAAFVEGYGEPDANAKGDAGRQAALRVPLDFPARAPFFAPPAGVAR